MRTQIVSLQKFSAAEECDISLFPGLIAGILFLAILFPAKAQIVGLQPGDHIRVDADNMPYKLVQGIVTGIYADHLQMSMGTQLVDLPWQDIYNVQVRREKSHKLEGLLIGGGAGFLIGGIIGNLVYSECESEELFGCLLRSKSRGEATLTGAILAGVPMGLIGLGIGALTKTDRWERVQLGLTVSSSLLFDPQQSHYLGVKVAVRIGKVRAM